MKTIVRKINNRYYVKENGRSLFSKFVGPKMDITIYHCCIQKSASQWFTLFFGDPLLHDYIPLRHFNPDENFVTREHRVLQKMKFLPQRCIVSPLYIHYRDFQLMKKMTNYKVFYVMRDPRDLVISSYFSNRYSHSRNYLIDQMREEFEGMPEAEGIMKQIKDAQLGYFHVLEGWADAEKDERIKLFRYEDLFGPHQHKAFKVLLDHIGYSMPDHDLQVILDKYTFKNLSGRNRGSENIHHHYRKGVSNDWKNYFTDEHKDFFNKLAGPLLVKLGYEKSLDW